MAVLTFWDGRWVAGNPPIMGPMTHAAWMASIVFDGARAFDGVIPDLDLHCARLNRSAATLGLEPALSAGEIETLCRDGVRRFAEGAALYIRPSYFGEAGFVAPEPTSTRFSLVLFEKPMPGDGITLCLSKLRRPAPDQAPTAAKAACLYPQAGLGLLEAKRRGFDDAVILGPDGDVVETMMRNLFLVRDGVVVTPAPNGSFLAGITRQRVLALLRDDGVECIERTVSTAELDQADEMFITANAGKVQPVTRYEGRDLPIGAITKRARELYFDYAKTCG